MTESEITIKRMIDLSRQSFERGIYTYSDFLTLSEQSDFETAHRSGQLYCNEFEISGGIAGAERVMIRFGSENMLGYKENWPIACIKIEPLNKRFAEDLSHRDVLGSLMNMGIERSLLGDIIFPSNSEDASGFSPGKKCVYVFAKEHIADTLCRELTRIKHTSVNAVIVTEIDENIALTLKDVKLQVKSERIDLVISHVFSLSRSQTAELFGDRKVFINGRLMENESHILKDEDVVSVRGMGRFIYRGIEGKTKKGNLNVTVSKYV